MCSYLTQECIHSRVFYFLLVQTDFQRFTGIGNFTRANKHATNKCVRDKTTRLTKNRNFKNALSPLHDENNFAYFNFAREKIGDGAR